ncbi:hypothetical protein ACP70R_043969 [Stipagrostis hirtigluma subsp. patula]
MHAAWLVPYSVCATTPTTGPAAAATLAAYFEHDCSSPASSAGDGAKAVESGSSPSAASTTSSSSNADQFASRTSRRHRSRSASPSCFGVRGAGKLLRGTGRARARSPEKQRVPAAAAKRDPVGRYLHKISKRLRRARAAKEAPPPATGVVVADDTPRWRDEAVAGAIAHCNGATLRRGTSPSPPSPSLDGWLIDVIASTVAHGNSGCADSPPPPWPPRRDVSLLERQEAIAAATVAHGKVPPHHGHGAAGDECGAETAAAAQTVWSSSSSDPAGELESSDSFDELEYLETFDGDEEMINRHFITIKL